MKFVKIQSSRNIQVTCGLQCQDLSDPKANIPDRLKVASEWARCNVLIREGQGLYPAEIAEWNTVKSLEADGVLSIGGFVESNDEEAVKKAEELKNATAEMNNRTEHIERRGRKKLSDIADE